MWLCRTWNSRPVVWAALTGAVAAAGWALGASRPARAALAPVLAFLSFYSGVFALVALTLTVMVGVLAADHAVVGIRYRLAAQAVHRALTLVALVFLVAHIVAKVATARAGPVDGVVPFVAARRTFYIGLGTLASDALVLVAATGIARHRFAHTPRAWRLLHVLAYAAWPLSLVHGLLAGRRPAWWVDWSYGLCLVAVALALLARLLLTAHPGRAPVRYPRQSPRDPLRLGR